ncbi:SDR family oxidoreductase [Streptococcus chenjunshii]|uniref:SDR family oxidoreductase n=1 Tax=Streptococcus chenjunshii TaxID=2173853 RepID=A0A372KNT4_9STRE|nr:SDR family oxidoreductase [Streptococcus chenjunshii]AXQ78947.1 SDR family oxidoreductase [Streptococcus chenjunshii]RFU51374.1 SDR family oxidoreductase [Streptococcus chenjunshii]RFU53574.1 SDR family oxidoreductase [Streptococcus chenjunshii]
MTNTDKEVVVLLGAGAIGLAIARRVATNKVVLLGDISEKNLEAAKTELENAGFTAETAVVDGGDRQSIQAFADKADALGKVTRYIHTAGVSPNQASFKDIVRVDLVGTAIALEVFGKIIADGGSGIVVASMAGHMFVDNVTLKQRKALAQTPADELADLDFLQDDTIPGGGYGISKQANILRVQAESLNWAERGARLNTISPGIIITPLARHELKANPEGSGALVDNSATKRMGTTDEVGQAGAYLLSDEAGFITGSDLLIDGGVIAAMKNGRMG